MTDDVIVRPITELSLRSTTNGFDEPPTASHSTSFTAITDATIIGPDVTTSTLVKPTESSLMAVCHPCCGSKLTGICCRGGQPRSAVFIAILLTLLLIISGLIVAVIHLQNQSPTCKSSISGSLPLETHESVNDLKLTSGSRNASTAINSSTPLWTGIRLPRHVVPVDYRLELRIDPDRSTFVGSSEIDITVKENTNYVVLHATLLLGLDDVTIGQINETASGFNDVIDVLRVTSQDSNEQLVLETSQTLRRDANYTIRFNSYNGPIGDDLRGLYKSSYRDQNGTLRYLVVSQFQSIDARRVFPCFDEPSMKASFTVSIIRRQELTALSNTRLVRSTVVPVEDPLDGGFVWIKDQFEQTPKMSTYLLAFIVTDFKYREQEAINGLKVRVWARPDMFDQTEYPLELATKAYAFYTEYFQTNEVVAKADHAAIPDFSAGAMENWGLVLYRESALLHDDTVSSLHNKYWVSLVIAHEIAHTWFGNMVTMAWWDDLWLNEGFANTLMYFALDSIYSTWNVLDLQLVNNIFPVMTKDSLLTSHAISTPIVDPEDITLFFDTISYDKGLAVLRLLRGFLGWENFRSGLQTYVTSFKFSNAEMSQLWQTFQTAAGDRIQIGDVMDTWTRQMGYPVVKVSHVTGTDNYVLSQTRFLVNPSDECNGTDSPYGYKWKIPFIYKVQGDDVPRTQWMDMSSAEITVPSSLWIIGNDDYMGFYRTNYDEEMWLKLTQQLLMNHTVFSAANRAGLINDAFNLARANQLSYDIVFSLTSYLHNETDYVPWAAFLDVIDFIDGMLSTSDIYGLWQKYLHDLMEHQFKRLGTSGNGELLERITRSSILSTACVVNVHEAIDWAKTMFNGWMKNSTKIPPDYALVIYATGIHFGGESEWDFLYKKYQTSRVASEIDTMMMALARTQQPWLLWRYVRMSLDVNKVRMQDIRNLFRYYTATPLGRLVTLQFLLTNFDEINNRFGSDPFLLRDVIVATTNYVNTEQDYMQLNRLFHDKPPTGAAGKTAIHSLDMVRSNINWMSFNYESISRWLTTNVAGRQQQ